MKLLVITDVHGEHYIMKQVLEIYGKKKPDDE